jgi:hypothetical protein
MFDSGGDAMKVKVEDFRRALNIIGDAGGAEVAIVAQFALDLAITAQFRSDTGTIEPDAARRLLHLRIARHRAGQYKPASTIH